ncbi:hypothetical protein Ddc_18700 [Ditylenchus destructor]|nr:hypothetical protein Ddc_18700 [Ditylenchus destructor]
MKVGRNIRTDFEVKGKLVKGFKAESYTTEEPCDDETTVSPSTSTSTAPSTTTQTTTTTTEEPSHPLQQRRPVHQEENGAIGARLQPALTRVEVAVQAPKLESANLRHPDALAREQATKHHPAIQHLANTLEIRVVEQLRRKRKMGILYALKVDEQ